MARNYAALPHDYLEEMDILSDAEFGRLCRALLIYSMTGKEVQLEGAEKVLLKRVLMQERRFQSSYEQQIEAKRGAGKKGAKKRWQTMADDGSAITEDGTPMADDGKNGKTETKTKIETKTNIPPPDGGENIRARDSAAVSPAPVKGPTWDAVEAYAAIRGRPDCAKPFFDYYSAAGWRDKDGVPCAWNWQAKFIAWEMREDKQKKAGKQTGKQANVRQEDPAQARKELERMKKYAKKLREEAGDD